MSCSKGGRTPRRASVVPGLIGFDWDSLAQPDGMQRLRRLILMAMVQGQLKSGAARFVLEQAEKARAAMPRQRRTDDRLMARILAKLPPPGDEAEESADGTAAPATQ